MASAAALISTILPPMAAKAMDIIKDKGLAIVRSMADKAMDNIERDISRLQITLRMIQGIVRVAEEKQIDDDFIRNWLRDLIDIGYEARDVLDDFITFSSCIITAYEEASNAVNFISSFMLSYFGGLSSDTSNTPLAILNRLAKDIRSVREKFDKKTKEGEILDTLISVVGGGSGSVHEVGPFINKQRDNLFLGRDEVKAGIMEKILHPSDDNRVHVVAIWGMGGIGKTTLARSIYNDERVKKLPRRWLSVGVNKFSAEKVIREIVNDQNTIGIGRLQEKLVKEFRGNRFLIVLDDVWDVDGSEWVLLFNPLTKVGKGGLIIITRRDRQLCDEITIQTTYNLQLLSEQDSWSIFESCAYVNGNSDSRRNLEGIGKEIVKKLNGLPLALKVVGLTLLDKDSSTWTNFLESNQQKFRKNDGVMSALRRSYNHLPPHLKMCFTYCSLFPKSHVFIEKVLVEMWMAHDLIQKEEQERPEDVGAQYFEELVNASLLQCIDGKYVMHDLIHDLALLVSNGEFASANSSLTNDQMKKVRHITITGDDYSKIPRLCKIEKLLTLYPTHNQIYTTEKFDYSVLDDVFKQLKSIRVLVLDSREITNIPACISELRHLRYLDVSLTSVKSLQNSLCHLYNLQMLAAPLDAVLPRDILNMVNLRYLRAHLPTCREIKKLTSLQELSSIHVCEGDNIRELGGMQILRGKLTIRGLENVDKLEDDVGALMEKQTLMDELVLKFDKQLEKSTISEEVLDALGCPPNITYLQISGYTGVKSPNWMVDGKHKFYKLQKLELFECPKLESLPPLGDAYLSSLRDLFIEYCPQFQSLPPDFHKLSSLNSLKIKSCPQLESLPPNFHELSSLESLHIEDCPQLESLSPYFHKLSSLRNLNIENCPQLQSLPPDFHMLSSLEHRDGDGDDDEEEEEEEDLKSFKIKDWPELQSLLLDFHKLSSLESLSINRCPQLQSLPSDFHKLSSLKSLYIEDCPQLQSLSPDFHKLSSLKSLYIEDCPQLQSLPPDFHKLSSLKSLFIEDCPQLQLSIPYFEKFSSLDELHIISCPQDQSLKHSIHSLVKAYQQPLEERCKLEPSHDWHKIKHIRNLYLYAGNLITVSGGTLEDYCEEEEEEEEE